jgi:hypothetical protein
VQILEKRRGGSAWRENGTSQNCVQCAIAAVANQPTAAYHCRQCVKSTDKEGVSIVDMGVLVSVVSETIYERWNSQFARGGLIAATTIFKTVPIDLAAAFCDAEPDLWRRMTVKSNPSKHRVKYVTTRMEGTASFV